MIQRALASLEKLEDKLGLYKLFNEQQKLLTEADSLLAKNVLVERDLQRLKKIVAALRSNSEQ